MLGALGGAIGLNSGIGGLIGGAAGGILGYAGVQDTNKSNEGIASARNVMEREEAEKARQFSGGESQKSRDFQASQVAEQMGFQERMSSTAVQRRMQDMKAAGINPILAGKFDASTPAGAAGSGAVGATAKANAHGYTAQNKIQGALDNAATALQLKKLYHETNIAENTEGATNPAGTIGNKANNAIVKASSLSEKIGTAIGSSAYDLKQKADGVMKVITGKIKSTPKIIAKKLKNPNLNSPFYHNRIETDYSHKR